MTTFWSIAMAIVIVLQFVTIRLDKKTIKIQQETIEDLGEYGRMLLDALARAKQKDHTKNGGGL